MSNDMTIKDGGLYGGWRQQTDKSTNEYDNASAGEEDCPGVEVSEQVQTIGQEYQPRPNKHRRPAGHINRVAPPFFVPALFFLLVAWSLTRHAPSFK